MGGMISGAAPINEAVNLINSIEPAALDDLKIRLPTLDLRPGIVAGEPSDEETRAFLEDKARVIEKAADVAEGISKSASEKLKERIRVSNRTRLIIQIVTVLSSASVLGTLIADQSLLAKITSAITTAVAVLGIFADKSESLLISGSGNIFDAYQKLNLALVKLREARTNLQLSVKHARPLKEIQDLIATANEILEGINSLIPQL